MKIITANLNGIRSAHNKGFFNWLLQENADIICLQEIKANLEDIPKELLNWNNYYCYYHPAQKKGYSGVAILSKKLPLDNIVGLNNLEIDNEGRYIQLDFEELSVVSLYMPSGASGEDKQQKKFRFMQHYLPILQNQLAMNKQFIICGDWNIAHQEIDLKNWKGNLKNSGFLPEERQWISNLFNLGFVDSWRHLYADIPGYTWWSNRGQAYTKDVGWRIDYHICTPQIAKKLTHGLIYKEQKFSDHAPLIMHFDI